MKKVEMFYNPYKMETKLTIEGIDIMSDDPNYAKFRKVLGGVVQPPLQTWIDPISYLGWKGFVAEISSDIASEIVVEFTGRKIDFEDMKRSLDSQNEERDERIRNKMVYDFKEKWEDGKFTRNVEHIVKEMQSDRFRNLIGERVDDNLKKMYEELDRNYREAKEKEFYIVVAGEFSAGKSTLLNALIRHDILPVSSEICTRFNWRIRHDSSLGKKISLMCYENTKAVITKEIYAKDNECASRLDEILALFKDEDRRREMGIELEVDLSYLYPSNINENDFRIVLIDTPGIGGVAGIEKGINQHDKIALEAISMSSKPMVLFCADGNKFETKNIGEFMQEILIQSDKERGGFNDRFLFLLNRCDEITYKKGQSAEQTRKKFAEYLTDFEKWGIPYDNDEKKELAEKASQFIPRIFMTAALVDCAIRKRAYEYTNEQLKESPEKRALRKALCNFKEEICLYAQENYYLSKYCDIPSYQKKEIDNKFQEALGNENKIEAARLQCGIETLELAIRDYIARYAYPIKVRDLLDTFEIMFQNVKQWTEDTKKEIDENLGKRNKIDINKREEENEKKRIEESQEQLKRALERNENQCKKLDRIEFDGEVVNEVVKRYRIEIEKKKEVQWLRDNPKVETGLKSSQEIREEIERLVSIIWEIFETESLKAQEELKKIKSGYNENIQNIIDSLNNSLQELDQIGIFKNRGYTFQNTVWWRKNLSDIGAGFQNEINVSQIPYVNMVQWNKKVKNTKREEGLKKWWNPFKWVPAMFMNPEVEQQMTRAGYYETRPIIDAVDNYYTQLKKATSDTERDFKENVDKNKKQAQRLLMEMGQALTQFYQDIERRKNRIADLDSSLDKLQSENQKYEADCKWLGALEKMMEGE